MHEDRILSGMRPTGKLHLGNYHGALKNWVNLQHDYESFFMVADWHALTTAYDKTANIANDTFDLVIDWLAAGIDPEKSAIFLQSHVIEHAELHLLLSMITPNGWLERVPTYKDQQANLADKDLSTYGFLGYPLLQAADIALYRAGWVPVGEDQIPHVEFTREIVRRFNHVFGREPDFEEKALMAAKKMGNKNAKQYLNYRTKYQEQGDDSSLNSAKEMLLSQQNLNADDKERLLGYLEGTGKTILVEPEVLLTKAAKMPGLDGRKMSKSYGNTISLRESDESITQKIKKMPTDPARIRRDDPGDPAKCPVWQFHQVYSDEKTCQWVQTNCKTAGIGCLDCKQPVIDGVLAEIQPIRARAQKYIDNPQLVQDVLQKGCVKARKKAQETMQDVRLAIGLDYPFAPR